jgi:hypothetical protein
MDPRELAAERELSERAILERARAIEADPRSAPDHDQRMERLRLKAQLALARAEQLAAIRADSQIRRRSVVRAELLRRRLPRIASLRIVPRPQIRRAPRSRRVIRTARGSRDGPHRSGSDEPHPVDRRRLRRLLRARKSS